MLRAGCVCGYSASGKRTFEEKLVKEEVGNEKPFEMEELLHLKV